MIRTYVFFMKVIIWIILLSVLKVDRIIDRNVNYYPLVVCKAIVTELTKLSWSYGFFTSDSDKYQYLNYTIALVDEAQPKMIEITRNGQLGHLGTRINAIRLNTCVQQIARDSMLLEAGSRSIALYLFNKYDRFRQVDFSIQAHNCTLKRENNRFYMTTTVDTLFNNRLSY